MAIKLTPIAHGSLCHGHKWDVTDESQLAEFIAFVALGHARHVIRVLTAGPAVTPPPSGSAAAKSAISMLTVSGSDPSHRDGWMFQVISWLAAHAGSPDSLLKAPHIRHADKGLDGLRVDLNTTTGRAKAVVIFEDKATVNPRDTIRDQVWPELKAFEAGSKENELVAELTALLQTRGGIDIDAVLKGVLWKRDRYFRVSITVDDSHGTDTARKKLFKGFNEIVKGAKVRRAGETLQLTAMRTWMESLANKAIASLKKRL